MSLPSEYDCWRCASCPEGKDCRPIYQQCDECNDECNDCDSCHGDGGGHYCAHDPELEQQGDEEQSK